MSMWTAIALIVIAGCAVEAFRIRHGSKAESGEADQAAELQARIERLDAELRQRIEVLERIVTDDKQDLKRQFDYLDKAS